MRIIGGWLALVFVFVATAAAEYPCRWVFGGRGLQQDRDVEDLRRIIETGAAHGINGIVLSAGLDSLDRKPAHYFPRLEKLKAICEKSGVEIIPAGFGVGYGGNLLMHDHNLAEGLPVRDARFVAHTGEARLETDFPVAIPNGGFEYQVDGRARGCRFHDLPGEVSFIDTRVFKEGKASLRFENFGRTPHGHGRVMYEVRVKPYRCYRYTGWVKTQGLEPAQGFRVMVLAGERALAPCDIRVKPAADWQPFTVAFNSLGNDKVSIYTGIWDGKQGKFWLDDLQLEEVALVNVLRRPGTPLVVRDHEGGTVYEEGRDYAPVADPQLDFRFDHPGPAIRLLPGTRIRDGQALGVSFYHGMTIYSDQVVACMSEPKVYKIWEEQVRLIEKHLSPKRWMLGMDEVRMGGTCAACKAGKMTMAQRVGDCVTRQCAMIRSAHPGAEVFVWSDMFDPKHNARNNYYLVEGDFTGSWQYLPKDLRIVCWAYDIRKESLAHFSRLGFKTVAAAYYDASTLENPKGWLDALRGTPGALGIMYTTWENKYELLGPFGDLVSKP